MKHMQKNVDLLRKVAAPGEYCGVLGISTAARPAMQATVSALAVACPTMKEDAVGRLSR